MEKEKKKKYPVGAEHYSLYEQVGTGASAVVYRALCKPLNEIIAVKILDFERSNSDLDNISREAQIMILVDHPNVLKSHCSFISDHNLWVVMPYMAGGSCLHILKAANPDGFEEAVIATILREVLKGLEYLHDRGHIHRDVKAGNILIDPRSGIKLGDFGVSAYLFDNDDRRRLRNTFVGTPCWMAPEVMEQTIGYDFKADIWSFGITALELAHGHAPFSKYPPMKVLLMTLQNAPPGLDYERDKKFSKSFKQMIARCLVKDPSKRPLAKKLLKHSFFKQARSNDYIARHLLEGLPDLGDRLKTLKEKEEDMLAQKKMPDGQKEEISQNEYKRGISAWDFNLEDLKAQAVVDEDFVMEKDEGAPIKQLQQLSFASDASDDNGSISVSSMDSTTNIEKHQHHLLNLSCDGLSPKAFANGNDIDEKAKNHVVQQKGRFKVTSENIEAEKVVPSPVITKSHSLQLSAAVPAVSSPLPIDVTPINPFSQSLFPTLQSILQANILQRDSILKAMKQVSVGDSLGSLSVNIGTMEKSLLELAHDREKELLNDITDLQWRLVCANEELQKCKKENGKENNI